MNLLFELSGKGKIKDYEAILVSLLNRRYPQWIDDLVSLLRDFMKFFNSKLEKELEEETQSIVAVNLLGINLQKLTARIRLSEEWLKSLINEWETHARLWKTHTVWLWMQGAQTTSLISINHANFLLRFNLRVKVAILFIPTITKEGEKDIEIHKVYLQEAGDYEPQILDIYGNLQAKISSNNFFLIHDFLPTSESISPIAKAIISYLETLHTRTSMKSLANNILQLVVDKLADYCKKHKTKLYFIKLEKEKPLVSCTGDAHQNIVVCFPFTLILHLLSGETERFAGRLVFERKDVGIKVTFFLGKERDYKEEVYNFTLPVEIKDNMLLIRFSPSLINEDFITRLATYLGISPQPKR